MQTAAVQRLPRPLILGVINATPDSFSDGGAIDGPLASRQRAIALLESGASYVDLGAESTRPGAKSISTGEEWGRLEPILKELKRASLASQVSIDTRHSETMMRAVEMGCAMINCVGEIPDADVLKRLVDLNPNLHFVATHMHGEPKSMQANPLSAKSVVKRVEAFFESAEADLKTSGFKDGHIWLDPGIGFGKTDGANIKLFMSIPNWARRYQIACGVSRKSLLGRISGEDEPQKRDGISKIAEIACLLAGTRMIRTHDVAGLTHGLGLIAEVFDERDL